MQLIDKKIDLKIEINKLQITNNKLVREIARHKLVEAELKQKLKHKKATT
jgi:hypothetical protein